ncbi:MAG: hypothetical protein P4L71_20035 [Acetobacteraceae bacterium]|nr:hypothetical protein [Acetobacteraceae bacterium]
MAKKWISGAINPAHRGVEQRAAARAGETTHEYMEQHKEASGAAGARARLGLRLEGMHLKADGQNHAETAINHAKRNRS